MRIKIDYRRFFISIGVILFGIIFLILLTRTIVIKNIPAQEDNISFIKKMFDLKNATLVESDILIQRLPDDTFMYKYLFEDDKSKYAVYMKEDQKMLYFKKFAPSDVVNNFSLKDVKTKAFKTLYKLAPYTKGNVDLYIEEDKSQYICNFYRVEGDKKVLENWAKIVFNKDNGELLEYDINWFSNVNFKFGVKSGDEKEKILKEIKVVPVIDRDSFLKWTTANNVLSLKELYYDYVQNAIFPKLSSNALQIDISSYNKYVDSALKKASVEYIKLKIGKILNLVSSLTRHIPFSSSEFKYLSSGYAYGKNSPYGKITISVDKLGNIINMKAELKTSSTKKKMDTKVLNDRAEDIMRTLVGKYATAKMYIFDDEKKHSLSYKFYIGNVYVLNGILNISFDKSSGEVTEINFDLGFRPEFMQKAKNLKNSQEYINLLKSSGFEEVFVLTKDYGKVYLFENAVEAHLALRPKFDLSYLMNAIR